MPIQSGVGIYEAMVINMAIGKKGIARMQKARERYEQREIARRINPHADRVTAEHTINAAKDAKKRKKAKKRGDMIAAVKPVQIPELRVDYYSAMVVHSD